MTNELQQIVTVFAKSVNDCDEEITKLKAMRDAYAFAKMLVNDKAALYKATTNSRQTEIDVLERLIRIFKQWVEAENTGAMNKDRSLAYSNVVAMLQQELSNLSQS